MEREVEKGVKENDGERAPPARAGLEDDGKYVRQGTQAPVESGKGKKGGSPLAPSEGTRLHGHLTLAQRHHVRRLTSKTVR